MHIKLYIFLVALALLPSCYGPKHRVPHHDLPAHFEYQADALPTHDILMTWWHQFNDSCLDDLIANAVEHNYELAIAVEHIAQARAFYHLQQANLFPQINVGLLADETKYSKNLQQTANATATTNKLPFLATGFYGSWELDLWGKLTHEKYASCYTLQAQIEQMHGIYLMIIAEVAYTYINLCALNSIIALTNQQICAYQQLVALQTDLFDAGLSSEIDLAFQEQQLATAQYTYDGLITERALQKNKLAILLGENPEQRAVPLRNTVPLSNAQLTTGLPSELLKRRPDIRQKERELAARNEQVAVAIAQWFPSITLFGGYGPVASVSSQWLSGSSIMWTFGPSISCPLLNFGRITAQVKEQEAAKRAAALEYSQTIIQALAEVEDTLISYVQNQQRYNSIQRKYCDASVETTLQYDKFCSGLASELTYLNALLNELNVKIELVSTQQAISTSLVGCYKALGGGW
jgi:NodT family efflux transporter outer membrane factor (OMF) lipoprotein